MFELIVARQYLFPRWRQLSVSLISSVAVLVIALVVWLILLFFSVTLGLEKNWVEKLITLTAPVRLLPTAEYYNSYYYRSDSLSSASHYTLKSLYEKRIAMKSDPYRPDRDPAPGADWPEPLKNQKGEVRDLVKEAVQIAESLPGVIVRDFDIATASLKVPTYSTQDEAWHGYPVYVASWDPPEGAMIPPLQSINAVLLPLSMRSLGILPHDHLQLAYYMATTSGVQEQALEVEVDGFYDPGLLPIGGRFLLADRETVSLMQTGPSTRGHLASTGLNLYFHDMQQTDRVKRELSVLLEASGLAPYWKIETFRDYEFARDFLQQLQSEHHLWSLVAGVILVVACSNIISMLLLLVNDKKLEIGILRALGASGVSIAAIFGICGLSIGILGSALGILLAIITLHNLQTLVDWIGHMQGYDMFNPLFYGASLPNSLSTEALVWVMGATACIAVLAAMVPATKACALRPASILRAE